MNALDDPWRLPSGREFLEAAVENLDGGGALLVCAASTPTAAPQALEQFLNEVRSEIRITSVEATPGSPPAQSLSDAFGLDTMTAADLAARPELIENAALIEFPSDMAQADLDEWEGFLRRFVRYRAKSLSGLAIVGFAETGIAGALEALPRVDWQGLRRLDATIWAHIHARPARRPPLEDLAEALAVELGGWNLALVARIAGSIDEDLFNPLRLLDTITNDLPASVEVADSFSGRPFSCSLALLATGNTDAVRRRVWRAQLRALFPWIEEIRQQILDRHGKHLMVDQHQWKRGVYSVEEMEFGGIFRQLESKVQPKEEEFLRAMSSMRNALAHRKPVDAGDLEQALRHIADLGYGLEQGERAG